MIESLSESDTGPSYPMTQSPDDSILLSLAIDLFQKLLGEIRIERLQNRVLFHSAFAVAEAIK